MKSPIEEILIASGNKGKLVEIATLLDQIGIKAISAANYNLIEPEETGYNFADNALIKAKYYGDHTGILALADDSGLCIDALDGRPGIHSARFAIDDVTGEKNFNLAFKKIQTELAKKNLASSAAHFICNLTLYNPKTREVNCFEGRVDGQLKFPAQGNNGFGYDPIFIPAGYDQTFAQMPSMLKDQISHRTLAFEKLVNWLNKQQ